MHNLRLEYLADIIFYEFEKIFYCKNIVILIFYS